MREVVNALWWIFLGLLVLLLIISVVISSVETIEAHLAKKQAMKYIDKLRKEIDKQTTKKE